MYLKKLLKLVINDFLYYSGISRSASKKKLREGVILGYHRVLPPNSPLIQTIQPGMYVTTTTFESHIKYLKKNCNFRNFADIKQSTNYSNTCIITFDDGWYDNYEYAFPILKKYKIPATIFITTNWINSNHLPWPNKIYTYFSTMDKTDLTEIFEILSRRGYLSITKDIKALIKRKDIHYVNEFFIRLLKNMDDDSIGNIIFEIEKKLDQSKFKYNNRKLWMSWDNIIEMKEWGIQFGAHTHNHTILTSVNPEVAFEEILTSRDLLNKKIKQPIEVFSYPNGNYNSELLSFVKNNGFNSAVTTRKGTIKGSSNEFELNRLLLHNDISKNIPSLLYRFCRL